MIDHAELADLMRELGFADDDDFPKGYKRQDIEVRYRGNLEGSQRALEAI